MVLSVLLLGYAIENLGLIMLGLLNLVVFALGGLLHSLFVFCIPNKDRVRDVIYGKRALLT